MPTTTVTVESRFEDERVGFRGQLSGSGTGWSCTGGGGGAAMTCVSDVDIAGGAALPDLSLTAAVSPTLSTFGVMPSLEVQWSSPADQEPRPEYDGIRRSIGVAPPLVDLVPVVTGPARAQQAGSGATAATTKVVVAARNVGRGPSAGATSIGWSFGGQVVSASGSGWVCVLADARCTSAGGLAAGATTSAVTLTVVNDRNAVDAVTQVDVSVGAAGDGNAGNDSQPVFFVTS